MRPFLTSVVVAATIIAATIIMVPTLALAGNQEVATGIAKTLQDSGQLKDYKIGVKYQDGTAWLKGWVKNQQQMNAAMKIVFRMPGMNRVVNDLKIGSGDSIKTNSPARPKLAANAQRVPASFEQSHVRQVAAMESRLNTPLKSSPIRSQPTPRQVISHRAIPRQAISQQAIPQRRISQMQAMRMAAPPIPVAYMQPQPNAPAASGGPMPAYVAGVGGGVAPARYDQPHLPNYAWPSYSAYPNYASLTYPRQYSPTAWPYIGPFYPYPQVPLGWRKVTLEWDDGWWMLDFKDHH